MDQARSDLAPRPGAVQYLLLGVGLCLAIAFITWPHARVFTSHVVSHQDPLFSMWRLGWFAHAIAEGKPVLHANIFHPEPYTLLLSDAMFLQGAIAAPAIWGGVALTVVYNTLLVAGMVSSGLAIYWLASILGIPRAAAVVAAFVFALAPYRIEHIIHLELQWIAPAILAFGSLYRVLFAPRWRDGMLLGVAVWLQVVSSVYYAVFLLPILTVLAAISLVALPKPGRTIRTGLLAVALSAALTAPIAKVYMEQQARVGQRPQDEISMFSATPQSYLASPKENTLYGLTADRLGGQEKRLFPGAVALALATVGLFSHRRRIVIAAVIVVLLSWELSLGVNGVLYPLLLQWWPPLRGLRVSARYGVYVLAGIAILASLGCERLMLRMRRSTRAGLAIAGIAVALALVEYRSPQRRLSRMDIDPPVYRFLRQQPESVLLEVPLPSRRQGSVDLDIDLDIDYAFWSTRHWHKLLNGHSGYYPPSYAATVDRLRSLPDTESLAFLRERGVRYVVVHGHYFQESEASRLVTAMLDRSELRPLGSYWDWIGPAHVFELTR